MAQGNSINPEPKESTLAASRSQSAAEGRSDVLRSTTKVERSLVHFPLLPDAALIEIAVVSALISRSAASIWRDVKAGRLTPVKTASRSTRFKVGEVRRLMTGSLSGTGARGNEGVAMTRVYLAGKISKEGDWRRPLLRALDVRVSLEGEGLSVVPQIIHSPFEYVGPFFVSCDHGCAHGANSHGALTFHDRLCEHSGGRQNIVLRNFDAIDSADLVFAYITASDCYGTIGELAWATAKQKRTVVAVAPDTDVRDLWHTLMMPGIELHEDISSADLRSLLKLSLPRS
ncbi:MAG: hypothetical protein ABL866_15260 [Devosia sp.]